MQKDHIGIKNYKWEKDPQGINHGYYLKPEIWLNWSINKGQ